MPEPSSSDPEPAEPAVPDPPTPASQEAAPAPRPSLFRAIWRGMKTGILANTYVAGPIGFCMLIAGLVPTAFGLGAGQGFGVHNLAIAGVAVYALFVMWGIVSGLAVALAAFLIDRIAGRSRRDAWRRLLDRPVRFFSRRRAGAVVDAPARPRRRRRWPWLVGGAAFLILAAAFGAGSYYGRLVERRLAAAIAEADRDDPAWRLDDLIASREGVPVEDNSTLVMADVVAMMPDDWPARPRPYPGGPPPPPDEAQQALDRLAGLEPNVRMDDATAEAVRAELADHAEAVELARTVADYDRGEHELEIAPNPLATLLPETQAARPVSRLLAADAALLAHDGEVDAALDSCRAMLGVGRSLGDEPYLISMIVKAAVGQAAMNSARRVLAQGEPSDEALAAFQADLLRESPRALLVRCMQGERANLDEFIRRIRDGEIPLDSMGGGQELGRLRLTIVMSPWGRVLLDNQRALALRWSNELVSITRQPPMQRPALLKRWEAELSREAKARFWRYTSTLPVLMMPAISSAERASARYEAALGASVILLAAERHRRKTGSWPESAAAIDRAFLAEEPLDPFSGEPFRIERQDGRFLVYSVGPNLKDEHGAFDPKKWLDGGPDDTGTGAWDPALRGRPSAE